MKLNLKTILASCLVTAALWSSAANAQLTKTGFFAAGDGLLVTDTATGLQWLSPYATRAISINSILGGYDNLATTYGFSYAGSSDVLSMINNNFNNPPVGSPGTTAGYTDAADFFGIFGINEQAGCYNPGGDPACPRTQGFAIDNGGATVTQIGMLQFNGDGYVIDVSNGGLSLYGDYAGAVQLGSWLVRPASAHLPTALTAPVPEPSTWVLMLLGFGSIGAAMRRSRNTDFRNLPKAARPQS